MPEKGQFFIFTSSELSLIKNTFADNEELLYAIRKVFLQFPLTDGEKAILAVGVNGAVIDVLKKRILPDLAPTYPIGQLPSLLTTLTKDIQVKGIDEMAPQFAAKQLEIEYLEQQFEALKGNTPVDPIILAELGNLSGKDEVAQYVEMTAYLFLLGYIDPCLAMIREIAGQKDETPEEQKKRMTRDSSK